MARELELGTNTTPKEKMLVMSAEQIKNLYIWDTEDLKVKRQKHLNSRN
jgi:hypothetical protein